VSRRAARRAFADRDATPRVKAAPLARSTERYAAGAKRRASGGACRSDVDALHGDKALPEARFTERRVACAKRMQATP
jgi:hypothetical protein